MARAPDIAGKIQNSLGVIPGVKFFSPFPFAGMNTQASPTGIADGEFLYVENFIRLGDGNYRTAWDIGTPLYKAPDGLKIVSFFFYTIATTYYAAVFLSDGSAVQVNTTTGATTPIGGANTFYQMNGPLAACAQWGTLYLLIANRNTVNDYWAWDGATLYTAGTSAPNGVDILFGGRKYNTVPTVTAFGGHGSGMTFLPTVQGGEVVEIKITSPGSGYEVGDVVQLAFSGGGGDTSPILEAVLNSGTVASANITAPGSGYTAATVAFSGGGGTGAAGTVTIGSGVSSVTVTDGGSGYTDGAFVSFSGGSGSGAAATAVTIGGVVTEIDVTDGGSGYTGAPTVTITGAGTLATATATITNGQVIGITITDPGSGYTSAPSAAISGDGSGALAVTVLSPSSISSVTVVNGGTGFTSVPSIAFIGGSGTGATGAVTLSPTSVATVNVTNPGQNYTKKPTAILTSLNDSGSGFGVNVIMSGGQVAQIQVTNAGSGYTGPIQILLLNQSGDTTGSGATATVVLQPTSIASVLLGNRGKDYTDAPAVQVLAGSNDSAYAAVTMMPFGVSGSAIETYQQRVWIANPQVLSYATIPPGGDFSVSAPESFTDFATTDGGVLFTNSDGFLQTRYTAIKQSSGYLYMFGDGSVSVISSVNTSGNPATTTFNYQNVDPQTGNSWRDAIQPFGRSLILANETGAFGLYGGSVTLISAKLQQLFNDAVFPPPQTDISTSTALAPSSSLATLFNVKHYLMLMTMRDPDTGVAANKMVTWNERDWTVTSQSVPLIYIGTQTVESKFQPWGTDGSGLYPLFSKPSATLVKRLDTKLYGGAQNMFMTKEFWRLYAQAQDNSSAAAGVNLSITFAVSGLATQGQQEINVSVPSGVSPGIFYQPPQWSAPSPAWPVFGVGSGGGYYFNSLGLRISTTSPDFTLANVGLAYTDYSAFM